MRRFRRIEVMSQMQAVEVSRRLDAKTAIISITAPHLTPPGFAESRYLLGVKRLCFYDIASDVAGMSAPKEEDFNGLKEFVDEMEKRDAELYIVHCAAGISRSAGLAAALGEYLNIDPHVFGNPAYFPNRLVYRLAQQEFEIAKDEKYFSEVFRGQIEGMEKSIPKERNAELNGPNAAYLRDPQRTVRKVVTYVNRGRSVDEIARKAHISTELAEKIVRLILTHPGEDADGILAKMGM